MTSVLLVAVTIFMCLTLASVSCQEEPKKVGEPIYHLEGGAAGKNLKNFQGGYVAGIGTKVWEKKDKSLELGATYGRNFARVDGHTFKSEPAYGIGATFRWGKRK